MNTEPQIRFAEPGDMDQIVELSHLHAVFEKSEYDSKGKAAKLESHLFSESPSLYCLVAELEGKLVGYASFMKQFSTWDADYYIYMDCLYLREEARGFGIGEKLMNRMKGKALELGIALIQWQTPAFNIRAMKFYDRIGGVSKSKERYFLTI